MTTTDLHAQRSPTNRAGSRRLYWFVTGLFSLIFICSGVWTIIDPEGARLTMVHLGFPTYLLYPQAIAKLLGIAVILWGRSRTLTALAFAGFLYDLLLAMGAHIAEGDPDVWLAGFALLVWAAAFWADRQRFASAPLR